MSYLARLKQKFPENAPHGKATKGSKAPSVPFVAPVPAPLRQISAATEICTFSPPGDSANDDEALRERVAIMMDGNGWDATRALQEARWQADKERCWRTFLLNAKRVVDAPKTKREALLAQYQIEAIRRYGPSTGSIMAESLRDWVTARRVHY